MRKEENEELEKIKRRKLEEMMRRVTGRTEGVKPSSKSSGKPIDLTDATFTRFVKENAMAVVAFGLLGAGHAASSLRL